MFKQIRNKILRLNMVMGSSVVIVAFAVIFATTYTRTQNDNREKLLNGTIAQLTVAAGAIVEGEASPEVVEVSTFATRISPDTGLSFSLLVDAQTNLVEINSMVDLQMGTYRQAVGQTIAASNITGMITLEDRKWQYNIEPIAVLFRETATPNISFSSAADGFRNIRFLDVTDSHKMLRSLALTLSGLTLVVLTVFFFISRFFANRALKPMEEAWEKQSRFVADASHELKTPLSVITANCGVLYSGKEETVESQLKWVDNITRATDRISGLVGSLLSLASMEDVRPTPQSTPVELGLEVAEAVAEIEAAALAKGLVIQSAIEERIKIESNREHVRKILSILLDNAVKYTDSGERITVSLEQEKRRVTCSVRNSGAGVPPEDLPYLFDRFYRRDPARSSDNGGYGLGLAIAQAIANQLDATLTADSVPGNYTEFRLVFEQKLPQ